MREQLCVWSSFCVWSTQDTVHLDPSWLPSTLHIILGHLPSAQGEESIWNTSQLCRLPLCLCLQQGWKLPRAGEGRTLVLWRLSSFAGRASPVKLKSEGICYSKVGNKNQVMSRSFSRIPWAIGDTQAFLWLGCLLARVQCLSSQLTQWENSLNIEQACLNGVQWDAFWALW